MRSKRHTVFIVVGFTVAVVAVALTVAYQASQRVPEYYTRAIAISPEAQTKESDRLLEQAVTLNNAIRREGQWQEVFKASTINGWLAVDLARNHPYLLPSGFTNPRIHITPQAMMLACEVHRSGFHGVVSLEISAFIDSPNVVGLRIHKARLGAIPWSLDRVLKGISDAAVRSKLQIRWGQVEGDPVALVTFPNPSASKGKVFRIESIRLDEGSITIAGSTERDKSP